MNSRQVLVAALGLSVMLCGLIGCGSDDPANPGPGGDTTAPQVVGNDPQNGEVAISLDDSVKVTFSEAMDPTTSAGNVTLSSGAISGMTWNTDRVLAIGHADWAEGTQVTATVGTGLKDAAGNALAAPYSFSFWTMSTTLLIFESDPADGATGVNRDGGIVLTFSSRIPMASFMANVTLQDTAPVKATYPYTVTELDDGIMLLNPDATLPAGTTFWVVIGAGLMDQSGGTLGTQQVISFTTGVDTDTTPPTVLAVEPANGSTNVPADYGYFRMTFSEPMDPDSVEPTSWNLAFLLAIQTSDPTPEWTENNTVFTVSLPTDFAPGTPIEIVFGGMSDLAGNVQTTPYTYSVKIAGNADYVPFVDGTQFLDEITWEEGNVGSSTPTDMGSYTEYNQIEAQPNSVFREAEYTDFSFTTPTGFFEEYRVVSNALEWVGFEDSQARMAKLEQFSSPLTILPLPIALGSWTDNTTVTIVGEGTFVADLAGTVQAKEDLPIVDSGGTVFVKDAWRVARVLDVTLEGAPWITEDSLVWYAPNYGLIRHMTTETDDTNWYTEEVWRFPSEFTKLDDGQSADSGRLRLW